MPEYLSPGVYVEEFDAAHHPIEGVTSSTAAFLGETERGPVRPQLVTSHADYTRWFGGTFAQGKYMPHAVRGFFDNGGRQLYVCRITGKTATAAFHDFGSLRVAATGPGAWGKRVFVQLLPSTLPNPDNAGSKIRVGFRIQAAYWSTSPAGFAPFNPLSPAHRNKKPRPDVVEDFDNLSLFERSPNHFAKRVNGTSTLIGLSINAAGEPLKVRLGRGLALDCEGNEANPLDADYEGDDPDPDKRTGLSALALGTFRDVALVYAPGVTAPGSKSILERIIAHCERGGRQFAVVDCAPKARDVTKLDPRNDITPSSHAAFYYPWIVTPDPRTGARQTVPPGGHVLGIYARVDAEHGVFKAPANEPLRGAVDLEFQVDGRALEIAIARGVNVIRRLNDRRVVIWGAGTLSTDSEWKYVNVRRTLIFLEASIYEGIRWAVFEPNDERLWVRVSEAIGDFLTTQWQSGALMGATPDKAFFVRCDRTTMTQDDIDNGRLICVIGVAPVKPAEFVIIRIGQWVGQHNDD